MSVQKFWLSETCPKCERTGLTWVEDNADGTVYDGQEWFCDECKASGFVVVHEDSSISLPEHQPENESP